MTDPFYEDASVQILHGDCRELLPGLTPVDHVITDPPYSEHVHGKQWVGAALTKGKARYDRNFHGAGAHKELGFEHLSDDVRAFVASETARLARRWSLVFTDIEGVIGWRDALTKHGLDYVRACVWVKPDSAPQFSGDRPGSGAEAIVAAHVTGKKRWNGGGHRGVFTHGVNSYGRLERAHPSPKPEPLMSELIQLFTDPGDLILDMFGGSGTTAVAAKRLGRRCILIEREEKYCEVAANRLRQSALDLWAPADPDHASARSADLFT